MISKQMELYGSTRSCIRELFEFGRRMKAEKGEKAVFDFSLGNPSVPAPKEVNEAIVSILAEKPSIAVHGYTSANGLDAAREAVARDLNERFGTHYKKEAFYMSVGAAMALTSVFKALTLGAETEFVAFAPFFPEYNVFARVAGARLTVIPPNAPSFQPSAEALRAALTADTQGVIVNSPNNPSGVVYTEEVLRAVASVLREKEEEYGHPIYLISDEPYRELVYDGAVVPHLPLLYKDTVICYSYSKSLSMPGERIGYVLMPDEIADCEAFRAAVAGAARQLGSVCAPSLMQQVIARTAHVRPDLAPYEKNRALLYTELTKMGYRSVKPDGAFYLFMEAPGGDSKAFSEAAKEKGLLIVPADDFGAPGWLRVSYCVDYDMIVRSLPAFEKMMEEFNS
ncbi:MAG: pyridoxal phosphate-dependent aminotransferase [Lachnospiraceae bacterium]|nr:pyridoxal phosphate-dependent aminotransferase [Lachnospiraceae bacterium]